jgi:8-oxo-dGTP diphosphatase
VTIVVDVANVMGSRPDGWWRDRAGAAVRLHAQIARLAASGRVILPDGDHPPEEDPGSSEAGSGSSGAESGSSGAESGSSGAESGSSARSAANAPAFVFVLEGAARAAVSRLPSTRPGAPDAAGAPAATMSDGAALAGPVQPGEVRVVEARGSGDDTIVAVVRELPGRRVVVTADRELRVRCAAAGAEILGPGWLLGLLRD